MRVVTRGDMDGLSGAVIASLHEDVESVELIHPEDITHGRAHILPDDIMINVPYDPRCAMWFDHHLQTASRQEPPKDFKGAYGLAPSAARLVYDFYGGANTMPNLVDLVRETDRLDSANLKPSDITDPQGYILLGFTIDSRTGLGAFKTYFTILYELLRRSVPIDEILRHPVVARRVEQMIANQAAYQSALRQHSRQHGNVVVTDFRPLSKTPIGNRFLVYALYPTANVSVRIHWGPSRNWVVASFGHSIFKRTCQTNLGTLASRYGGGGHRGAAGVSLKPPDTADEQIEKIVDELKRTG